MFKLLDIAYAFLVESKRHWITGHGYHEKRLQPVSAPLGMNTMIAVQSFTRIASRLAEAGLTGSRNLLRALALSFRARESAGRCCEGLSCQCNNSSQ